MTILSCFRLGDLSVVARGPVGIFPASESDCSEPATLELDVVATDDVALPGPALAACDTWSVSRSGQEISFVSRLDIFDPPEVARVDLRLGEARGTLRVRPGLGLNPLVYPLDQLLTIHLLHQQGGFLLHSACIEHDGRAYLVAGRSGAGKTTFSRAAAQVDGISVLTDERVAVFPGEQGWLAAGTPWHGEGGFALERTARVAAIFLLEKAREDELLPLSPIQSLGRLFACHFPALWMTEEAEPHTSGLERLVGEVPCYLLRNRLEGNAPTLVIQAR